MQPTITLPRYQIVLLPGMDGGGTLFRRFIAAAPPNTSITLIPLPAEPLTYGQLADRAIAALPDGDLVIVAESFSGPLALALAERKQVAALVFCNSFVVAPRPRGLRWLVPSIVWKLPTPRFLLRHYMLGRVVDESLVEEVATAIAAVPADVLAFRLGLVLQVDDMEAFARCDTPTLYLRSTGDRLVPDTAHLSMAARRPIKTAHVPGPHLLLQANPTGAWRSIVEFLGSLEPNRQAQR